MSNQVLKPYLSNTLRRILRPIVRIALRGQLTFKEFAELAKLAYFDVARDDFGLAGRKTNLARVAILTGLSRKECTRLKSVASTTPDQAGPMSPATRVITAWHEDPAYRAPDGTPLLLPLEGGELSVHELFRRCAGDIPFGALFAELQRIGAIEPADGDRWQVVKRSFIAEGFSQDKIRILGNQLSDLGDTIVHNIEANDPDARRMQRYVVADAIDRDDAAEFQKM
ncbi:MAG: DUF6502 family protein, partial [Gammaproteobacteria bacterium]